MTWLEHAWLAMAVIQVAMLVANVVLDRRVGRGIKQWKHLCAERDRLNREHKQHDSKRSEELLGVMIQAAEAHAAKRCLGRDA